MNCIFICIFNQKQYVYLFRLLLESIFLYGSLDENTQILVFTTTEFMNMIKQFELFDDTKIKFEINDDELNNIDSACKSRLLLFYLPSINNYEKILYLDTDILINKDINPLFDICKDDILYTLEEGEIDNPYDYYGITLFGNEIDKYPDKSAFTSGMLLFRNCEKIRVLFQKIIEDIMQRPYYFKCYDQPYIVYNAFKYNVYNNKLLKPHAVNTLFQEDIVKYIEDDFTIYHFPGIPGNYKSKLYRMYEFLDKMKQSKTNQTIQTILSSGFSITSNARLESLYNYCNLFKNTDYSFVEMGVAKGGCLAIMKLASGKRNRIFGFDSFDGMPAITKEDLGNYNKSCPVTGFGKMGDNLSGGINSVYITFDKLNLKMDNVTLVKGFFQDTLLVPENIENIGKIGVLRLDGDWYESTKICLETLYDKVVDGGVVIIDDYGHWIGAKLATDEFREKRNIFSPLIQTDYTEHLWIKSAVFDNRNDMLHYYCNKFVSPRVLEIGVFKGDFLSYLVSNCNIGSIDAVDLFEGITCSGDVDGNNVVFYDVGQSYLELSEKYKNNSTVKLHKSNSVAFLQSQEDNTYDIIYIDGDHSYDGVKNDLIYSYKKIRNGGYIMGHDYEMNMDRAKTEYNFGVKQAVDEFCVTYNQKIISKTLDGCVSYCIQISKSA